MYTKNIQRILAVAAGVLIISGLLVSSIGLSQAWAKDPGSDPVAARAAAGTVNGKCPVMGGVVMRSGGSADYRGERIGFCCAGCASKFREDPVSFMDSMRADPARYAYASKGPSLAVLAKAAKSAGSANGLCPVMQNPVKPQGGAATYGEQRIAFCCPGCIAKFKANPELYMRAMRADPGAYGYARPGPSNAQLAQARKAASSVNGLCPVMGNLVKPSGGAVKVSGQRVAFCCPGCASKFRANAPAYFRKMRAEPAVYGYRPPASVARTSATPRR